MQQPRAVAPENQEKLPGVDAIPKKEEMQILRQQGVMGAYVQCKVMSICALLLLTCAPGVACDGVPFTPVTDSVARRAVCMDGSPAGYHYEAGSGDGANSWLVVLMGGGWCSDITTCQDRRDTGLGSNRFVTPANFTGMLSSAQDINPDFYNWNRVFVVYCDQSSFLGDSEVVGQGPKLDFRGSRIFDAAMEDLMEKGLGDAENAILAGRSAGGLAAILHCDGFRALLPSVARVKCFSDAGFFIRAKNVANANYREQFFASTIMLHNISSPLPRTCTNIIGPSLCLFAEYLVGDVETPLFLLNSAFDYYQVQNNLVPTNSPGSERWKLCLKNLTNCPAAEELIKDFGDAFLEAITELPSNPSRGLFIHACFSHVVAFDNKYWSPNSTVKLGNMTMLEAFGDWYFGRRESVTLITPANYLQSCI